MATAAVAAAMAAAEVEVEVEEEEPVGVASGSGGSGCGGSGCVRRGLVGAEAGPVEAAADAPCGTDPGGGGMGSLSNDANEAWCMAKKSAVRVVGSGDAAGSGVVSRSEKCPPPSVAGGEGAGKCVNGKELAVPDMPGNNARGGPNKLLPKAEDEVDVGGKNKVLPRCMPAVGEAWRDGAIGIMAAAAACALLGKKLRGADSAG